jgi:hypothetical protein
MSPTLTVAGVGAGSVPLCASPSHHLAGMSADGVVAVSGSLVDIGGSAEVPAGVIAGGDSPVNRVQREEIARRMAALDYDNPLYGGTHREQWQAIALHLLKEYEFTDDTDRSTSKDFVRLCVLKDELRAASKVRITVNHAKEVFRILKLAVTGEWDRRGQYVYSRLPQSRLFLRRPLSM